MPYTKDDIRKIEDAVVKLYTSNPILYIEGKPFPRDSEDGYRTMAYFSLTGGVFIYPGFLCMLKRNKQDLEEAEQKGKISPDNKDIGQLQLYNIIEQDLLLKKENVSIYKPLFDIDQVAFEEHYAAEYAEFSRKIGEIKRDRLTTDQMFSPFTE